MTELTAPQLHPTAIVDANAQIGAGCYIGPYCIVGATVELGERCQLQAHVVLDGPTIVGPDNVFYAFSSIGQRTQDLKYTGEPTHLEIGTGNTFREFVTINRGTAPNSVTRIGNYGNFLAYTHIAHDCVVADHVVFSNNSTLAGHVEIGADVTLGGFAAAHQHCRIGRLAMVGGMSKIVQDVPPFCLADGNPAILRGLNMVGLKRHNVPVETVRTLKEAYEILFRHDLNMQQAMSQLREDRHDQVPEVAELMSFVETTKRGITRDTLEH
jgi:UDP-N-acetylglucosamine acyltransferase